MHHSLTLLTSAHNDALKTLSRLIDHGRERRRQGVLILEGIHLAQSALAAGLQVEQVFVNQQAANKPEVLALLEAMPDSARGYLLDPGLAGKVSALSSAPELLTLCLRPAPRPAGPGESLVLLEDIQDPGNLGTILRSAAAAGVWQVCLSTGCADVFSPKVLRAGMGAHFALSIHEQDDLHGRLAAFDGVKLVTSLMGDRSLYRQDLRGPVAFVFGNEGAGVSPALQAMADARVRIPMPGQAESLNVAMAATLCLFERVRQREEG